MKHSYKLLSLTLLSNILTGFQLYCMEESKELPRVTHVCENASILPISHSLNALGDNATFISLTKVVEVGSVSKATSVAVSPTGKIIACGLKDGTILLFDAKTGGLFLTLQQHTGYIHSLRFSHDSTMLATGSSDMTACLWDITDVSNIVLHYTLHHADDVTMVAFNPDDSILFTTAGNVDDGGVRLWDSKTGELKLTIEKNEENFGGEPNFITEAVPSSDGKTILTLTYDRTLVRLWNAEDGKILQTLSPNAKSSTRYYANHCLGLNSNDNSFLLISNDYEMAKIWNIKTGQMLKSIPLDAVYVSYLLSKNPTEAACTDVTDVYSSCPWRLKSSTES